MIAVVAGATGFVGSRLVRRLGQDGWTVRAGSRRRSPVEGGQWVPLDVDRPETLPAALRSARVAYYLVHGMGDGAGYERREARAASAFATACAEAGVERIVYLGGVAPTGSASRHLTSRLRTGELMRAGPVPVFELRAAMIVGEGSASWRLTRDLALRLPGLFVPPWLRSRSEPVAIADVIEALAACATLPLEHAGVWGLPGPETLDGPEVLRRVAAQKDHHLVTADVPFLPKRLASRLVRLVSAIEPGLAGELVQGLGAGLECHDRPFWPLVPRHRLASFDDAVRTAWLEARPEWNPAAVASEWISRALSRTLGA